MIYERRPFAQHLEDLRPRKKNGQELGWQQGEHLLIAAPTGAGKTTLMSGIVPTRSHVVVMVTKLQDPTFAREFKGWERYDRWPKRPSPYDTRVLLWPKPGATMRETRDKQREVFAEAFDRLVRQGKRCLVIDEMLYMSDPKYMGFATEIGQAHYMGRSSGLSMVSLTQRPSWIPRIVYSSVSHAYIAATKDVKDTKSLAELGGVDAKELTGNLASLSDKRDYVYVNPQGEAPSAIINRRS